MKRLIASAALLLAGFQGLFAGPAYVSISRETLMDKIKGGWAAQTIGCTYGGPTEFRYRSRMIPDSIAIAWPEHYVKTTMTHNRHLYDDVYMDLTFVKVFDKLGLDAPVDSFATAFANAEYSLWHANQQARYNILHGIMPPYSGHWMNNPHADDIDFQIEADYAGLMAPGMVDAACHFCDGIGHMMNYGDGWYGGVYVAALYSLAFTYTDIEKLAKDALKAIPSGTRFQRCMSDVIDWHKRYPSDWKRVWKLIEEKHGKDIGCPEGVEQPYNIDAVINSAYVLMGLLYGNGDFERTMEIATRCGQDSDCNPASAAGILGVLKGYGSIPEKFLKSVQEAEDIDFAYTEVSLNKAYEMSYKQALEVIRRWGGSVSDTDVRIRCGKIAPVHFEQCFDGMVPSRHPLKAENGRASFEFEGRGIVICGNLKKIKGFARNDYVAMVELWLDGQFYRALSMPADYRVREEQIFFDYSLKPGRHSVELICTNPVEGATFNPWAYIEYK